MNKSTKDVMLIAGFLIGYFFIQSFFFGKIEEAIRTNAMQGVFGAVIASVVYLSMKLGYLFLGYSFVRNYLNKKSENGYDAMKAFRTICAGILIVLAFDATEFSRISPEFLEMTPSAVTNSHWIWISQLDKIFPHPVSWWIFYFILPSIYIILAVILLKPRAFKSTINRMVKH